MSHLSDYCHRRQLDQAMLSRRSHRFIELRPSSYASLKEFRPRKVCRRQGGSRLQPIARLKRQSARGVGDVVAFVRSRSTPAIVLENGQSGVTTFGPKGVRLVHRDQLSLIWRPTGRGPAGALLHTIEVQRSRPANQSIATDGLMRYVSEFANASTDAARLFAMDALDLSRPDLLADLRLEEGERQLLYVWHELRTGTEGTQSVDRLLTAWHTQPVAARSMLLALWPHVVGGHRRREIVVLLQYFGSDEVSQLLISCISGAPIDETRTIAALEALARDGLGPHSVGDVASLRALLDARPRRAARVEHHHRTGSHSPPVWMDETNGLTQWLVLDTLAGSNNAELKSLSEAAIGTLPKSILEDLVSRQAVRTAQITDRDLRDLRRIHNEPNSVPTLRLAELGQDDLAGWVSVVEPSSAVPEDRATKLSLRWRVLAQLAASEVPPKADLDALEQDGDSNLHALANCIESNSWAEATEGLLADDTVAPVLTRLHAPPDLPITRSTLVAVEHLRRAKTRLHQWDWPGAATEARAALGVAPSEAQRDEALNLLAATQWQSGQPELAIAALNKALEGAYSDALIVNAAVVALELDRTTAIGHFARLAAEAPSTEGRALAAERAVGLWRLDGDPWDDAGPPIPTDLRAAMRDLVRSKDLHPARWRDLLTLLAIHDDAWLASAPPAALGPRGSSAVAQVIRGRATGPEEWLGAMAKALRGSLEPGDREFLEIERDGIVRAVIQALLADEPNLNAAGMALEILDQQVPVDADDGIALRALAAWVASTQLGLEEQEPSDLIIRRAEEATRDLPKLPDDRREEIEPAVRAAGNAVAAALLVARAREFDSLVDGYNNMLDQLRSMPEWQIDRHAVREVLDLSESFCIETLTLVSRALALAREQDLKGALAELHANVGDALNTTRETRKNL